MTQPNVAPLTIPQAEQRLAAAWGHPVTIRRDTHGYYAQDGDGTVMAFYHDGMLLNGVWETVLVPIIGDWPDCPPMCACGLGGICDCALPTENPLADAAQRWNEQRGA